MLFLNIFLDHFISAFIIHYFSRLLSTLLLFKRSYYEFNESTEYNSISILMLDSQVEQVEGLFSLPRKPFFHD